VTPGVTGRFAGADPETPGRIDAGAQPSRGRIEISAPRGAAIALAA
jgi:hypothetical protein